MTFAEASRKLLGIVAVLALVALAAHPARVGADPIPRSYHVTGVVTRVEGTAAAVSGLDQRGVKKNAAVSIDWTVDLSIPVHADNPATNTTLYQGNITAFKIQIGTWLAEGADPSAFNTVPVNKIQITDGVGTAADFMDLFRSGFDRGSDPNDAGGVDLIAGNDPNGAQLILHFFEPSGGASSSRFLGDQTPSLYLSSTGAVVGKVTDVQFAIPGIVGPPPPPPPDPTAKCRSSQIASAGTLCKSTFTCLASHAKATPKALLKNPTMLEDCRAKADTKFITAFDKAAATAASSKKGLSCGTTEAGATFISHFDDAIDEILGVVESITPPDPALAGSWYSLAGTMCSTAAKVESKNASKPIGIKLPEARAKARTKLIDAATKAVDKAKKKGFTFDPEPDVTALVDSIDDLIDLIVTELDGT
jgi:hypothetical protein